VTRVSQVFARARVFPSFDFEFWFDAYPRIRLKLKCLGCLCISVPGSRLKVLSVDWSWYFVCFLF
jgi:hypothetical protein